MKNNSINIKITKIKRKYQEQFSNDKEHDLYERQKKNWNLIRNMKKTGETGKILYSAVPEIHRNYLQK